MQILHNAHRNIRTVSGTFSSFLVVCLVTRINMAKVEYLIARMKIKGRARVVLPNSHYLHSAGPWRKLSKHFLSGWKIHQDAYWPLEKSPFSCSLSSWELWCHAVSMVQSVLSSHNLIAVKASLVSKSVYGSNTIMLLGTYSTLCFHQLCWFPVCSEFAFILHMYDLFPPLSWYLSEMERPRF